MRSNLPLAVLGAVSPILSWIEGTDGLRFPESWLVDGIPPGERERAWLVRELPTYSYDNVDEIIDLDRQALGPRWKERRPGTWAKRVPREVAPPPGYDLAATFQRLGERYFRWNSSELCVQEWRMEELHELALRFPVAHLIRSVHARAVSAGYLAEERALDLPEQLSLLHTSSHGLRTVVHRGVSEGHMHFSGVITAGEVWADHLLQTVTPAAIRGFSLQDQRLLGLSRAGVRLLALGVLLALVPLKGAYNRVPFRCIPYLDEVYLARNRAEERAAWKGLREVAEEIRRDLAGLVPAAVRRDTAWLLRLAEPGLPRIWRALAPQGQGPRSAPEGIHQRIGLLERLHFTVQKLLIDLPLPAAGRALEGPQIARELLHQVFFRYLVYHTHHWQLATQSGKTTGLRQFKRYFDSPQRDLRALSATEEKGLILERLRRADYLRNVEGRISMPRGLRDLIPWILGYAEGVRDKQLDGFGLVIHFLKAERGKADERALRAHQGRNRIVRFGRIRRRTRDEAFRLFRLLSTPHPAVPFIVGIDAANLELPTPPEVFAPAFRFLREYPIDVRRIDPPHDRFGSRREILSLLEQRRLGMTYHVGEEFRHLLSGLRAIGETIEFLNPRAGDRLGHAIALAVEPEIWAEQIGYQAVLPKQEWLDTLVWVHHFLGPGTDLLGELGVEDEIQHLSRAVYGSSGKESDWPIPTLHDAWRLRQLDPYSLDMDKLMEGHYRVREQTRHGAQRRRWADVQAQVLETVNESVGSNQAYRLLNLYWYHSQVRQEGDRIQTVDMLPQKRAWLAVCRLVQEKMKKLVQSRELIVEVNPSSNRLIGPFADLSKHHVFRMTLNEARRLAREVRVTVNTDDPGVFNTSLAHEYYLLGEILLQQGVPEAEVVNWLNWLRENGNDSCFVRTLPGPEDPRIRKVLNSLRGSSQALQARMGGTLSNTPEFWAAFWQRRQRQVAGGEPGKPAEQRDFQWLTR